MIMKVSESLFTVTTEILQVSSSDYLEFIEKIYKGINR